MTHDEALRIFQQCCGSLEITFRMDLQSILLNKKLLKKLAKGLASERKEDGYNCDCADACAGACAGADADAYANAGRETASAADILAQALRIIIKAELAA